MISTPRRAFALLLLCLLPACYRSGTPLVADVDAADSGIEDASPSHDAGDALVAAADDANVGAHHVSRYGWPSFFGRTINIGTNVRSYAIEIPRGGTLRALGFISGSASNTARIRMALHHLRPDGSAGELVRGSATGYRDLERAGAQEIEVTPATLAPGAYSLAMQVDEAGVVLGYEFVSGPGNRCTYDVPVEASWPEDLAGVSGQCSNGMLTRMNLYAVVEVPGDESTDLDAGIALDGSTRDAGAASLVGYPEQFASASAYDAETVFAHPIEIERTTTLEAFGFIASAAGGQLRMALFHDANGVPGPRLESTGTSAYTVKAVGEGRIDVVDTALAPGRYWLAYGLDGTSSLTRDVAEGTHVPSCDGYLLFYNGWSALLPSFFRCRTAPAANVFVVVRP
jgi:hypothetical protein